MLYGIDKFDDGVDDAKDGGNDGDIETCHTDFNIGWVGVVADVVQCNEDLEEDHAGGVDNFDDNFWFWAINLVEYKIDSERKMSDIQED